MDSWSEVYSCRNEPMEENQKCTCFINYHTNKKKEEIQKVILERRKYIYELLKYNVFIA